MSTIKELEFRESPDITTINDDALTDYEVRSFDTICVNETALQHPWWYNFKYLAVGIVF